MGPGNIHRVDLVRSVPIFLIMPIFSLHWKLQDSTIGILASISKMTSLIITAFATSGWVMFLGAVTGFLSSMSGICIRSLLSKCVSKSELGKVFSVLASLEAAVPLVAAPLFTFVYTSTLESFLGSVFLVQGTNTD